MLLLVRPGTPSSFLFLLVRHLFLVAWHLLLLGGGSADVRQTVAWISFRVEAHSASCVGGTFFYRCRSRVQSYLRRYDWMPRDSSAFSTIQAGKLGSGSFTGQPSPVRIRSRLTSQYGQGGWKTLPRWPNSSIFKHCLFHELSPQDSSSTCRL